ncbi:MAG: response regulator [Actinobacteria bacterium]|nr:response regulator [Actinomycetota bacterium]
MKLKTLVIDDSRIMRRMVMRSLDETSLAEFEFNEAEDGRDGLEKFSAKNTDIVFVDINMPNMNGIEFVRKVRAMRKTDHIPLIMITSEKSLGKIEDALDGAGANAYICKPFKVDELKNKISKLVSKCGTANKRSSGFFSRMLE